jgi:hypothetical protein
MAAWDRDTPWRQGHVLTNESSVALGVVRADDVGSALAVVISHDCDLAQGPETEPSVEIIVAKRVEAANGNFTHAKNSRRLHLECAVDGVTTYLDMRAQGKAEIKKAALADHTPNASVVVKPEDRSVLQRWLAARYRRAAFPDEFERRLNDTGVSKRIAKILEPWRSFSMWMLASNRTAKVRRICTCFGSIFFTAQKMTRRPHLKRRRRLQRQSQPHSESDALMLPLDGNGSSWWDASRFRTKR